MSKQATKTLDDIMYDMSELYDDLGAGRVELKMAAEKANVIFSSQLIRKPDALVALKAIND